MRLDKLLGQYALLTLVESEREGRLYCNIAGISALPKSMPRPEGINPLQLFDLAEPNWAVFDSLSEKVQTAVLASPEGRAAHAARYAAPAEPGGDLNDSVDF